MSLFDRIRGIKPQPEINEDDAPRRDDEDEADNVGPQQGSVMTASLDGGPRVTVHDRLRSFSRTMPAISGVAMDDENGGSFGLKGLLNGQPALSDALYMWFARQGFIGHQMAALVAQHWLVAKACNMPARDAVRNGWRVGNAQGNEVDKDMMARIERMDRKMQTKKQLREFLTMGRTFGIRVAIPRVAYDNPEEAYAAPFNIDGVPAGAFKGWTQVDPYWMSPMLDQSASSVPDDPHFYEPTWWVINGMKYHRSHLVIYRHGELADILKPSYLYGGVPVPQLIMERVYGAERTANEAPMLALTKRTVVYKTDLAKAMAQPEKLQRALEWMGNMWNNFGIRAIDKVADDHQQFDTALADLDAIIMTQYQLVASACEVPAVKLLGTSAKGFNATGEYDEASYHEFLESIQENDLQPFLDRHYLLMGKSMGYDGGQLEAFWNPLDAPTAAESATAALTRAQTGAAYVGAGVIDAMEERKRLARDQDGDYAGIVTDDEGDGDGDAQ